MEDDDILELTNLVAEEIADEAPAIAAPPMEDPFLRFRVQMDTPQPRIEEDRLVSQATASASAAAFSSMASQLQRPRRAPDMLMGNAGLTLEEIVRDELRPLLKNWLDANLSGIVERLVREELDRIAREAL